VRQPRVPLPQRQYRASARQLDHVLRGVGQHDRVAEDLREPLDDLPDVGAGKDQVCEVPADHLSLAEEFVLVADDRAMDRLGHLDVPRLALQRDERKPALRGRLHQRNVAAGQEWELLEAFCRIVDQPSRWRRLRELHRLGVPAIDWPRRMLFDLCMIISSSPARFGT